MSTQYFTTPAGPERRREVTARIWGIDHVFTTAAGVFSGDGLDHATAVLLRSCPPPVRARRLLDLGCGWGPIAVALATACPDAVVDAVDVNDRALELCAENAARAGVGDRVNATRPDEVNPHTVLEKEGGYDEIWSNPPIRIGKPELHALLNRWLPRLTPDGVARMVVGKNLGADSLQRWLIDQGWDCDRTASAKGFRVLAVQHASAD